MKKITIEEHFATEEQIELSSSIIEMKYKVPEIVQQEKVLARELLFLTPGRQDTLSKLYDIDYIINKIPRKRGDKSGF